MKLPTLEECKPGIRATGFAVIVALAGKETKTAGGIILPDNVSDRERMGEVRGRVVSLSPAAFDFADFGSDHPGVGDVVIFAKHTGIVTNGEDGREYRILQDRDVWGIVEENGNG